MSYQPLKRGRLLELEELEPRQLPSGTGPFLAVPLLDISPAVVSPAHTHQSAPASVTTPTTRTGKPATSPSAAPKIQASNGQPGQGLSTNQAPTTGSQKGSTPAQAFAAGNQSAFVNVQGLLSGGTNPTPGSVNGPVNQPFLSLNPAPNLSLALVGANPLLGPIQLPPQGPRPDPFGIRLVGGGSDLVNQNPPFNPRLDELEPETKELFPNPGGPVDGTPSAQQAEPNDLPPPANPAGQLDDSSPATAPRLMFAGDDLIAYLPQTGQDLIPRLDEVARSPWVLNLALGSSMFEPAAWQSWQGFSFSCDTPFEHGLFAGATSAAIAVIRGALCHLPNNS
jgi:hypothetical protein